MFARRLWTRIEAIHAVTYFAPESIGAAKAAGLLGFWMGYFGFRAAPLGLVGPGTVEATFANFGLAMVQRAIPDAWDYALPTDLVPIRAQAAAAALRRLSPTIDHAATDLNPALELAIVGGQAIGRPLFAANRQIGSLDDPVEQLWQNCTTLREHRGDGHVAALTAAGVDGCEAHLLIAADHGVPPDVFFDFRGWNADQQTAARQRLVGRNLLDTDGLTADGSALRSRIEGTTDELASAPFELGWDEQMRTQTLARLTSVAAEVISSETIPFPNPIGLPPPNELRG